MRKIIFLLDLFGRFCCKTMLWMKSIILKSYNNTIVWNIKLIIYYALIHKNKNKNLKCKTIKILKI